MLLRRGVLEKIWVANWQVEHVTKAYQNFDKLRYHHSGLFASQTKINTAATMLYELIGVVSLRTDRRLRFSDR